MGAATGRREIHAAVWLCARSMRVNEGIAMRARLSIGVVASQTGCTVPTIRYYEEVGLLPAAARTASGQRSFGDDDVRRLVFIRRCRDFGFSVEQIRSLVALMDEPQRPCAEVREIAAARLDDVRERLTDLRALEASLAQFVCGCDTACPDGVVLDCAILEGLAQPRAASTTDRLGGCCA